MVLHFSYLLHFLLFFSSMNYLLKMLYFPEIIQFVTLFHFLALVKSSWSFRIKDAEINSCLVQSLSNEQHVAYLFLHHSFGLPYHILTQEQNFDKIFPNLVFSSGKHYRIFSILSSFARKITRTQDVLLNCRRFLNRGIFNFEYVIIDNE